MRKSAGVEVLVKGEGQHRYEEGRVKSSTHLHERLEELLLLRFRSRSGVREALADHPGVKLVGLGVDICVVRRELAQRGRKGNQREQTNRLR
jgi:hypothetical protein